MAAECNSTLELFNIISEEFNSVQRHYDDAQLNNDDIAFRKIKDIIVDELDNKELLMEGAKQIILDKWWKHLKQVEFG